ncbi:hypothetical protein DSL92_00040 [Billgrantia gudaonensis]|uniref:peptide-methionine (S)-S-oxide reductase n=1 Tax=Billgrantia gudaonensis TaxID=376427 RepID=A0A432JM91_9GAMM|nr:hypothetical protein DSL92_00040 [Halomonas gudaonensis]
MPFPDVPCCRRFPKVTRSSWLGWAVSGAEGSLGTAGVHVTAVGYAGGVTPNLTPMKNLWPDRPRRGSARGVRPSRLDLTTLLRVFWEAHDPTQGMRPGQRRG